MIVPLGSQWCKKSIVQLMIWELNNWRCKESTIREHRKKSKPQMGFDPCHDPPCSRSDTLTSELLRTCWRARVTGSNQGHPTSIFEKYLFGRRFVKNFRNICFKMSCLPASPRIFEHLKKGIIAHFKLIFTLKRSPRIFGRPFSG